jgi:Na+-transporting NADH:ubiquinone oxidoreductase subunit NqrF
MPSYILRPPLLWRKAICSAKQGDRWSASTNNLIQNMLKTNPKKHAAPQPYEFSSP